MDQNAVDETLKALVAYEAVLAAEGVPFAEQRDPGDPDLKHIEAELIEHAGGSREEIVAWFHWQGGVPVGPERGRAIVYGGFRPVGLEESFARSRMALWYPVDHYPAPPSKNPWIILAEEPSNYVLIASVESGEIFTVTHAHDASNPVAGSVVEMLDYWTALWRVAFCWIPGRGVEAKIPLADIPTDLKARSGYGLP